MNLLKKRIGHTVLYKTKKFGESIGTKSLYLKMEGLNPTGHIHDRLSYFLVKEAVQLNFDTLTVASLGPLGQSLAYMAGMFNINCKIVMPIGSLKEKKRFWVNAPWVEIIEYGSCYYDALNHSQSLAGKNDWYDANAGCTNSCISDSVYSEIAEEITKKLGNNPDNVFCFLSDGAVISALHLGFRELWRRDLIQRIPRIFVACAGTDNEVYKAFLENRKVCETGVVFNRYKGLHDNDIEYNIYAPQNVLNAIFDSGGSIIPVTHDEIRKFQKLAKQTENLKVSFRGAAALSACERLISGGNVGYDETNVVILEKGKNDLIIRALDKDEFDDISELAEKVEQYLGKYGDDRESVTEAINAAFDTGIVLGAFINSKLRGLAVLIRMPVKKVLPEFHLVYIGADISAGSRGIGTRIMDEIRRLTGGNFSLHVDLTNNKAMRLYEKMGLKKSYLRMIAS